MTKLKNRKVIIPAILVLCMAIVGIAVAMSSDNYDLPWSTGGDSAGGGARSSENYQLKDVIGQTAPGSSSSANYHLVGGFLSIMPIDTGTGTMVKVYVELQGDNRPKWGGWEVPLTVCFCPEGSDVLNPGASPCFTGTATAEWYGGGTKAVVTVGPVNSGTYDITADSTTTLLNVKRGVHIE